jgi:3-phenylpropionate/cinnamic acid dioxygenase small subunit
MAGLFTEDCVYEIVPRENMDLGLPIGIMHCFGRAMLSDRITSLRKANVFEPHTYRHLTSGLELTPLGPDTVKMQSNYNQVLTGRRQRWSQLREGSPVSAGIHGRPPSLSGCQIRRGAAASAQSR